MTWKVWTAAAKDPVFEGDEATASSYIVKNLTRSRDAVLESPDGDSYAYEGGVWRCLDTDDPWQPATGSPCRPAEPWIA